MKNTTDLSFKAKNDQITIPEYQTLPYPHPFRHPSLYWKGQQGVLEPAVLITGASSSSTDSKQNSVQWQ